MCTVSFIARKNGYALAMNRDESIMRVQGLPPRKIQMGDRTVIGPSEPAGGTWIMLNDSGATFALINWYSVAANAAGRWITRGKVVSAVCNCNEGNSVAKALKKLPLGRINPFRLIGIFPAENKIIEWCWNLKRLISKSHRWEARQWISSGFDEYTAQKFRNQTFRKALQQRSSCSLNWLRRLHRSHLPHAGPFSICMHRDGSETVSYTEISISFDRAAIRYHFGAPCQGHTFHTSSLQIQR